MEGNTLVQTQMMSRPPAAADAAQRQLLRLQRAAVLGDDNADARDEAILRWRRMRQGTVWSRDAANERFVRWLLEAAHSAEEPAA